MVSHADVLSLNLSDSHAPALSLRHVRIDGPFVIGSPAADRYLVEGRLIGGDVWTRALPDEGPMSAESAGRLVSDLNRLSGRFVYRAVLVS